MTVNPAKLYKMDKENCIEAGKIADLVIFNPYEEWRLQRISYRKLVIHHLSDRSFVKIK